MGTRTQFLGESEKLFWCFGLPNNILTILFVEQEELKQPKHAQLRRNLDSPDSGSVYTIQTCDRNEVRTHLCYGSSETNSIVTLPLEHQDEGKLRWGINGPVL